MRILRKLTIAEISLVDKPANRLALIKIAKRDDTGDTMSTNFGKAAESDWTAALEAYAKRHNLTKSAATLEFANTIEAREIYKRVTRTPRAENISKSAAVGNVTAETLAKAAFPEMSTVAAMNAWLGTEDGRTFYSDDVATRTRAQQGF
jgi:hypothetical protein